MKKKVGDLYDGENMRSSSRSETVMSPEIANSKVKIKNRIYKLK